VTARHVFDGVESLRAANGHDLGVSDWITITQDRVDRFADATNDHQWIHVDPERARSGPFGSTIAHGFLTLALWPELFYSMVSVQGVRLAVNYGSDRVRFPAPVLTGCRVRAAIRILSVDDVPGGVQVRYEYVVKAEGAAKPSCVAQILIRYLQAS
jgi:acyl dehydratase